VAPQRRSAGRNRPGEHRRLISHISNARPPADGYRACWAFLRLGKAHGEDRLEWPAAAPFEPRRVQLQEALEIDPAQGLGKSLPLAQQNLPLLPMTTPNLRGPRLLPLTQETTCYLSNPGQTQDPALARHAQKGVHEQSKAPGIDSLSFEEPLGLLVDAKTDRARDKR